jgi:DivIVA domain-containing protein
MPTAAPIDAGAHRNADPTRALAEGGSIRAHSDLRDRTRHIPDEKPREETLAMTPDDVRSQRFTSRFLWGLSPEEVTAFLEDVADAFGDVQKTNVALTARVRELEAEIRPRPAPLPPPENGALASSHVEVLRAAALRAVEALLADAQARAQTVLDGAKEHEDATRREAEAMRARVQLEAEEIVSAATARAESLASAAREQEAAIRDEIDRLTQSHLELVDDVQATLDAYHRWLATVDPRGRARGRREAPETSAVGGNGTGAASEAKAG